MKRFGIRWSTSLLLACSTVALGSGVQLPPLAQCVVKSPRLQIGSTPTLTLDGITYTNSHQVDAPSPLELPIGHPGPQPAGT